MQSTLEADIFRVVETNQSYKLEVRWNGEWDKLILTEIGKRVNCLRGVEGVDVYRYTMAVYFALHVIDVQDMAVALRQALTEYIENHPYMNQGNVAVL